MGAILVPEDISWRSSKHRINARSVELKSASPASNYQTLLQPTSRKQFANHMKSGIELSAVNDATLKSKDASQLRLPQMTPVPAVIPNLPRALGPRNIPFLTFVLIESVQAMLIQATQLRPGMIVEYNKDLWRIMTITHITPGNWRGMVQTKLRNIKTGSQTENRFRSEDRVERVILNQSKMQFLYQDGDDFHFMNTENYEQITIPKDLIEDVVGFLTPNLEVEVEFYETTPLNVTLPKTVALKVVQTDPGMKTAAVNNTLKPATLETGMTINVPHFVTEGDTITINTETKEYLSRSK